MRLITPPHALPDAGGDPVVFLAGSIEQDRAARWQDMVVAALSGGAVTVLNPRRPDLDATWGNDLDDPRFAGQVAWELAGLERADLIGCYFAPGTVSPISLLECGLHARSGRLIVSCPRGFQRRGNVRAVCARYAVPLVEDLDQLIAALRARMGKGTASVTALISDT